MGKSFFMFLTRNTTDAARRNGAKMISCTARHTFSNNTHNKMRQGKKLLDTLSVRKKCMWKDTTKES